VSYLPRPSGLANATTTEQLSGRLVDGATSYVKLVKRVGALGTGTVDVAHGITGMTRIVSAHGGVKDTVQWFSMPYGGWGAPSGSSFGLFFVWLEDDINIRISVGGGWAGGNALSDAWVVLEYLK